MSNEKVLFERQIKELENLSRVYTYLNDSKVHVADVSMLLRSEYVLLVSAFDSYLHRVVCKKIVESFFEEKLEQEKIKLSLDVVHMLCSTTEKYQLEITLHNAIKRVLGKDSFQSPAAIEYALGIIDVRKIWNKLSDYTQMSGESNRGNMALIVQRRNQIAHEFDVDYEGNLREISLDDVNDCKKFLKSFVECIDDFV